MATVKKVKNLSKNKTIENRLITTSLIKKEEMFKMLALAEATSLPILFVGPPGTAKTKTVLDYAKAYILKDVDVTDAAQLAQAGADFIDKVFILETDEGTKSSEVKGMPNMQKLAVDNVYEVVAPITTAVAVVVNEIDKASSNIRNSLLGIMNEKFLFNGQSKIPCAWKFFIGTCNKIPKEEVNSPFWDRFTLKIHFNRITAGELVKYWAKGGRDYKETFSIGIPTKAEMESLVIPSEKLEKFIDVTYQSLSDRALTFVPTITKAISFIWGLSIDKALIKTCSIMTNDSNASILQDKLLSPAVKHITGMMDMLFTISNSDKLSEQVEVIESQISHYTQNGALSELDVKDLSETMNYIMDSLVLEEEKELEELSEDVSEFEAISM